MDCAFGKPPSPGGTASPTDSASIYNENGRNRPINTKYRKTWIWSALGRRQASFGGFCLSSRSRWAAQDGAMLEILQNFESTVGEAARAKPVFVIGSGIAAVAVGLCVWLGGLSLRKLLVALVGAAVGAILGTILLGGGVVRVGCSAVVATIVARVFERVSITVLGAAVAALIGFAVLAGPYIEGSQQLGAANLSDSSSVVDFAGRIRQAARLMPPQKWAIVALSAVIFLVGGLVLWRPTAALCFSVIGTMLIFAGMILLLVHKGVAPVALISSQPVAYAGAFAAMTLFGTVEQFLLCRPGKSKSARPEKPKRESRRD